VVLGFHCRSYAGYGCKILKQACAELASVFRMTK